MSPNQSLKKLRIFAASPAGMANERAKLEAVVGLLKPLADHIGVAIEVVDWLKVVPNMGRPQQVIFDQLQPTTWDVFIGILWHRFGTPTGGKDPQTQKEYLSGTEEEFEVAARLVEQFGKPRMMMYRCTRQVDLDMIDPDQFKRVKEFFTQFEIGDGKYRGLYQTFDTIEAFEKLLLNNLQRLLLEYSEKVQLQSIPAEKMAAIAPTQNPDNLPRRPAFFGRSQEMIRVLHALSPEERGWGVVIDGIGGIGKTALAMEAAYRCKEQKLFEAFIFISAKQKSLAPSGIKVESPAATTLNDFINETARVMGQSGIAKLENAVKRQALLKSLQSMRALLIYDNLETLAKEEQEALADFLRFLPQGCKAILTSRRRGGEGALWLRLEQLDWDTAREIIQHEAQREAHLAETMKRLGEERWFELYNETGGSPLALIWTLGLMRARAVTFNRAIEMLQRGASGKSDLQNFIYHEAHKELGANELAVLAALSFFVPSASFAALMAVVDLTRSALETALEHLDVLSLVDILPGEERYTLHPLIQTYIRDDLRADMKIERKIGMCFARYWVNQVIKLGLENTGSYKLYDSLDIERENIRAAANWVWATAAVKDNVVIDKEAAQMAIVFCDALQNVLWSNGYWNDGLELSTRAYKAAYALADWIKAGWRAYDVAWIYYKRDHIDVAEHWAEKCTTAWAHSGDKRDKAIAMQLRGLIAKERNDDEEAGRLYQDALAIWRDLNDSANAANVLNNLGELARKRRDLEAAESYYYEALKIAQNQEMQEYQAYIAGNLGLLYLDTQNWVEARKWCEQALKMANETMHIEAVAHAKHGLALVWQSEKRLDLALQFAEQARAIYERLQHRDLAATRELVARLTAALEKKEQ